MAGSTRRHDRTILLVSFSPVRSLSIHALLLSSSSAFDFHPFLFFCLISLFFHMYRSVCVFVEHHELLQSGFFSFVSFPLLFCLFRIHESACALVELDDDVYPCCAGCVSDLLSQELFPDQEAHLIAACTLKCFLIDSLSLSSSPSHITYSSILFIPFLFLTRKHEILYLSDIQNQRRTTTVSRRKEKGSAQEQLCYHRSIQLLAGLIALVLITQGGYSSLNHTAIELALHLVLCRLEAGLTEVLEPTLLLTER